MFVAPKLMLSGFRCPGKIGGCGFGRIDLVVWNTDKAHLDFAAIWHDLDVSRSLDIADLASHKLEITLMRS